MSKLPRRKAIASNPRIAQSVLECGGAPPHSHPHPILAPVVRARRAVRDFEPDGNLDKDLWQTAASVRVECETQSGNARPSLSTTVRLLWSLDSLYLAYCNPYTRLTVFEPAQVDSKRFDLNREGVSLWDRDVVEAFICAQPGRPQRYAEFEVAPTNERLDLMVDLPAKDFLWTSGFRSAVRVDATSKQWTCELRIPLKSLCPRPPVPGECWRLNLFRCDRASHALLAWNPTLTNSFHTPLRLGILEFIE